MAKVPPSERAKVKVGPGVQTVPSPNPEPAVESAKADPGGADGAASGKSQAPLTNHSNSNPHPDNTGPTGGSKRWMREQGLG